MACSSTEDEEWIDIPNQQVEELQSQVDEGHRPGLLDWSQVAREYVSQHDDFSIDESVSSKLIVDEESKKVVQYSLTDGRLLQLELTQPVTKGSTGIFVVSKYRIIEENTN